MDDAETSRQQQRVMLLSEHWLHALGLDYWTVSHCWHRGTIDDCEEISSSAVARCEVQWQYLNAMIHWNLHEVAAHSDEQMERVFIHECMHIFLHELRGEPDDWLDHEERVAQLLMKAILWVRDLERVSPTLRSQLTNDGVAVGLPRW